MEQYDVVVIGAGLAGLHLARLLAHQGLQVLLVDRKTSLEERIQTTGIFVRRTLEDFHIPEDCLGPAIRHVTLYSPSRRRLDLSSPYDEFRIGRMAQLYNRILGECVHAGATWLPGTRYAGFSALKGQLVIRLDRKASSRWVKTKYLVGADGADSRVARDLQLDTNQEWIVGIEDVFKDIPLTGPPRLHCFLDPKIAPGYIAWFAHDGEEAHVGVGGYPALFNPVESLARFRRHLDGIVDLSGASHVSRRSGKIPLGGILRRISNSHGLLIGDAAGAVSPLTAGGLDPCLRLSTFAARVILKYLETGEAEAFQTYSGEYFRLRFTSRLWMRRLLGRIRQPILLEIGLRFPLINHFARHVFFSRGSFPDVDEKSGSHLVIESGRA